jgi:hypothetical protein
VRTREKKKIETPCAQEESLGWLKKRKGQQGKKKIETPCAQDEDLGRFKKGKEKGKK